LVPRLAALGAHAERFHIVQREPGHMLTSDHLIALLAEYRPTLVVLDTTSQLALDARVDPNDGSQVGPFLRPLVDAVRAASTANTPCAGVFIHHAPHHAARAAGSLQWGAIVDADLVLRRRRRGVDPRAAEPEDAEDAPGGDDGTRILEGVTRAAGPLKLRPAFVAGRYALADAGVPIPDVGPNAVTCPRAGPPTRRPAAMDNIGLALHKRETQLCVLAEDGTVTERRIVTTRDRFTAVLSGRAPARVLPEASTESEWVARHLAALGHQVVVADPNFAPMYATRSRRVKTDRRDALTLAEACRAGTYRPAHRTS
jgi:hypothetical protein